MNEHLGYGSASPRTSGTSDRAQGTTPSEPGTPDITQSSLASLDPFEDMLRRRSPVEASDARLESYPSQLIGSNVQPPQLEPRDSNDDAEIPPEIQQFIPFGSAASLPPLRSLRVQPARRQPLSSSNAPEQSSRSSSSSSTASVGAPPPPRSPTSFWNSTLNLVLWPSRRLYELAWLSIRLPTVCLFLLLTVELCYLLVDKSLVLTLYEQYFLSQSSHYLLIEISYLHTVTVNYSRSIMYCITHVILFALIRFISNYNL